MVCCVAITAEQGPSGVVFSPPPIYLVRESGRSEKKRKFRGQRVIVISGTDSRFKAYIAGGDRFFSPSVATLPFPLISSISNECAWAR